VTYPGGKTRVESNKCKFKKKNFQLNALSRGSQRPNLPYKMALQKYSGEIFYITSHRKTSLADCYWALCFSITILCTSTFCHAKALILLGVLTRNNL